MDLFKSGNPTLSEKAFKQTQYIDYNNSMTVRGTLNKFGFMFLMLLGTAYYSWKEFAQGGNVQPLIWTGAIGGLVVALVIMFKKNGRPTWPRYMPYWKGYLLVLSRLITVMHLLKKHPILS